MNSCVGMTMAKKEMGQDAINKAYSYFSHSQFT